MTTAAELLDLQANVAPARKYWDKANYASFEDQQAAAAVSTTIYVGNLSYYTSEQHVYELARLAGPIRKVIMGLHREKKTPCGFAFVEFFTRAACLDAEALLNGKTLEGRVLKIEIDPGFKEGRQFGRGPGGGQVRDDFRQEDDPERGGIGKLAVALSSQPQVHAQPHIAHAPIQPGPDSIPHMGGSVAPMFQAGRPSEGGDYRGGARRGRFGRDRDARWSEGGGDNERFRRQSGGGDRGRARSRDRDRYGSGGRRGQYQGGYSSTAAAQAPLVDEFGRDIIPPQPKGDE